MTHTHTHTRFYTQKVFLHTSCHTRTLLHTDADTHTSFYTHHHLLHTDASTHGKLLHTGEEGGNRGTGKHTDAFTHRSCYTHELLHTEAVPHRSYHTNNILHTEHCYTHTLAQKHLIELLMWNASYVQKTLQ